MSARPELALAEHRMDSASIHEAMLTIELAQMRSAAVLMASYILSTPSIGMDALSEVRRTANAVMAANGLQQGQGVAG